MPSVLGSGTALVEVEPPGALAEMEPAARPETLARIPRFALRERLRRLRRVA